MIDWEDTIISGQKIASLIKPIETEKIGGVLNACEIVARKQAEVSFSAGKKMGEQEAYDFGL